VVSLNGTPISAALVVADVAIRSGRTRSDDGLSASSATVELLTPDPAGVAVSIADTLAVAVDGNARFQGRISEITRATGLEDPASSRYTLIGVGPIARLPRVQIPMPLAAASGRVRMQSVFDAAGIPVVIEGGDSYQLAALGVAGDPPSAADQIVGAIMSDTGCVVADLGDGSVLAQFLDSRLSEDVWSPDPALTHVELAWEQTDDLVNDITVEWPGGAPATNSSQGSIAQFERHAATLNTGLGRLADATHRAASIVSRLAFPAWQIGAVDTWDQTIMAHRIGAVVTLAPLPASSPISGGAWSGVLEGWSEQYGPDADGNLAGTWTLALSDRAHSSEALTWANVSPQTLTWAQVLPATSWSEAISNGDLSNLLRDLLQERGPDER
jgi:hypothetical protein